MSFSSLRDRRTCIIEIEAEGLTGVGESWINYPAWAHAERLATLRDGVVPLLFGLDISNPMRVQERLTSVLGPVGRQWGAPGPIWQAISAVDLALWDLKGKMLGLPVHDLLSDNPARESIPAYGSGVGPDRVAEWCETAIAQELDAVKLKLGFGREQDIRSAGEARGAIGPARTLFADANQAWTVEEALDIIDVLADFDTRWIEEPVAGDQLHDLAALASTRVPIATGENIYGSDVFEAYIRSGAIGTIQPDLTKCGGISVGRAVAAAAQSNGIDIAPHCYGSAVGIAASLHLAAAFPSASWMELDVRPNPLRTEILTDPLAVRRGSLDVPAGTGLGIELDPDAMSRFCDETIVMEPTK